MEGNITELQSVDIQGNNLSLIIDSQLHVLTGPWHFDEEYQTSERVDLNEIKADFNFLINLMGTNNLLHPDDYDYSKKLLQQLQAGKSLDYHLKVITPQAEVKQIHGYGSLQSRAYLKERIKEGIDAVSEQQEMNLVDEDRLVNVIDTSKYLRHEGDLKKDFLQKVLDTLPQMVWTLDVKTQKYFFNDRWYAYTGMTPEQCVHFDHQYADVFHPSQRPERKHIWDDFILKGEPYSGETLIRNSKGDYRWHLDQCIPIKNSEGEVETWVGTFIDVHDQFTSEKKLKENTDLLQAIFNSSNSGIEVMEAVHATNGEVIDFVWRYHNHVARRIRNVGKLVGKMFTKEFPESLRADILEKMTSVLQTNRPMQFEQQYPISATRHRWLDVSLVKLGDSIVVNFHDITERKATEIELQKSKHFILQITNSTPDIIYVFDVIARSIVYVSAKVNEVFGQKEEFVYSQAAALFTKVLHPDDFGKRMQHMQALSTINEHETKEVEVRLRVADGSWRWFKIRDTLFKRKENGMVWLTIGLAQDVHEKRIAEEKLNLQHQIDRQVEKIANIGSWHWNLTTNEVMWGENLFRLLGYDTGSVTPSVETFLKHIHADDREAIRRETEKLFDMPDGPLSDQQLRVVKPDGSVRYLYATGELISSNDERHAIGTLRDITQEVWMQHTLAERAAFTEALIENSIDRIFFIDNNYKILTWNKRCELFYDLTKEQVVGKNLLNIFPEVSKNPALVQQYQLAVEGASIHLDNEKSVYYSGYYEAFLIPMKNEMNEVYGVLSIIHDITEHVDIQIEMQKLNETLTERNARLKSLNTELSTFAFVASHDLREPLRKIKVFSQSLEELEKEKISDKGREYIRRMVNAVSRMETLIDDVLTFSRTTSTNIRMERVNLRELFDQVLDDLRETIASQSAIIDCEELPVLKGNRKQLLQLFHNLLVNALKFRKPDVTPHIKITCSLVKANEVENAPLKGDHQYVRIEMADNGIGFEQQYAEKIFQIFQRLHGISEFAGTGIGLAICKKIIENHHGFINAKSNPGEGATFTCYLPYQV